MSVIVTDAGFAPDDWQAPVVAIAGLPRDAALPPALSLQPQDDVDLLRGRLGPVAFIRIAFPSFADGRGFTQAALLRRMGYTGRLRAAGHVLADQYAMARRCGFDEVEIDDALAARQPEPQWRARADWRAFDHQARLRG